MSSPLSKLNQCVTWKRLLDVLKLPSDTVTLPAVTVCPSCSFPVLEVLQDYTSLGQWYHCGKCGFAGDSIELAAKVWGLSYPATIFKLYDAGFDIPPEARTEANIEEYERHVIHERQRQSVLVETGRKAVAKTNIADSILYLAGLKQAANNNRALMAKLTSYSTLGEVKKAIIPHSVLQSRLFGGEKWRNKQTPLLLFPFYELPEKICGVYCAGLSLEQDKSDVVYVPRDIRRREGGLYFAGDVLRNKKDVYVFNSPLEAARAHARYKAHRFQKINAVSWAYTSRAVTNDAWKMLRNRKIIFIIERLDYKSLHQAILCDATVFTCPSIKRYYNTGVDVLNLARAGARHWSALLSNWMGKVKDNTLQDVLLRLQAGGLDLRILADALSPEDAERISVAMGLSHDYSTTAFRSGLIEERNDAWYFIDRRHNTERQISNAVIRIEHIIAANGQTHYSGVIRHKGNALPFLVEKAKLRTSPANWLEAYMAHSNFGVLTMDRAIESELVAIAKRLHPPSVVQGFTRAGWDQDRQVMVIDTVGLKAEGRSAPISLMCDNAPTRGLRLEQVLPGDVEPWLERTDANISFWAGWLALVANIVAPLIGVKRTGLAVVGDHAAVTVSAASDILRCQNITALSTSGRLQAERNHNWPCVANLAGNWNARELQQFLDGNAFYDRNVGLRVSETAARVLIINGDFHIFKTRRAADMHGYRKEMLERVLPAYLQWVLQRPQRVKAGPENFLTNVASSVTAWLSSTLEINTSVMEKAAKALVVGSSTGRSSYLFELLQQAMEQGALSVHTQQAQFRKGLIKGKNSVLLHSQVLATVCRSMRLPRFNNELVHSQLLSDNALASRVVMDGFDAWLIKPQALTNGLRVVG